MSTLGNKRGSLMHSIKDPSILVKDNFNNFISTIWDQIAISLSGISITSSTAANPTVIQTAVNHKLAPNETVTITGHTTNTAVNNTVSPGWTITTIDATHFSIPVDTHSASAGSGGSFTKTTTTALATMNGFAQFGGEVDAWVNGKALWSPQYSTTIQGAVSFTVRFRGTTARMGAVMAASTQNSSTPTALNTGAGIIYDKVSGAGYPSFYADTGAAINIGNSVNGTTGTQLTYARSIDYTFIFVPRPSGGLWVLVSGGAFGTWPNCTMVSLDFQSNTLLSYTNPSAGLLYNSNGQPGAMNVYNFTSIKTAKLPTQFTTKWGPAVAADDFSIGSGAINGRSLQVGGGTWSASGGANVSGSKAVLTGGAGNSLATTLPSVPRWHILDIYLTANDGSCQYDIRFRSTSNLSNGYQLLINANASSPTNNETDLRRSDSSVFTDIANHVFTFNANTNYRIAICDTGYMIIIYINGTLLYSISTTTYNTNTRFYVGNWASTSNTDVVSYEAWPGTVTVPTNWRGKTIRPVITGKTTFYGPDNFSSIASNWTNSAFPGTVGGVTTGGSFSASGGFAVLTAGNSNGLIQDISNVNHGISMQTKHTVPSPSDNSTDWGNCMYLRFIDGSNFIYCRLLYQGGSCELELWQVSGNTAISQIFISLGPSGGLSETALYTFEGYVNGPDISIYLTYPSGFRELLIQDTVQTSNLLTGTKCGFGSLFPTVVGSQSFTNVSLYTT